MGPQSASCVRPTQKQDLHKDAPRPQSASVPRAESQSQSTDASASRPQSARPESAAGSKQATTTPQSGSLVQASPTQLEGRIAPSTYEGIKETAVRASLCCTPSAAPNRLQSASKRGSARPQSASCARSVRPQSASSVRCTSKQAAATVRPQSAALDRTLVDDVERDDACKIPAELPLPDAPRVSVRWDSPAFKTRADRAPQTVRDYSIVQGALDTGNQLPMSTGGCDAPGQIEVNTVTRDSTPKPSRPSSAQHTFTRDSSPKPSRPSSAQHTGTTDSSPKTSRPSSAQSSRPHSPRSWRVVEPSGYDYL